MNSQIIAFCSVLLVVMGQNPSYADEAKDRIDEMLAELGTPHDRYSVFIAETTIVNASSSDGGIVLIELLVRRGEDRAGRDSRVDIERAQTGSQSHLSWKHHLVSAAERYRAMADFTRQSTKVEKRRPDAVVHFVNWEHVLMNQIALYERPALGVRGGVDYVKSISQRTIEGSRTVDGFLEVVVLHRKGTFANIITFGNEPKWAPIRIRSAISNQKKFVRGQDVFEQLESWKKFSETRTVWEKLSEDRWVPRRIKMRYVDPETSEEAETDIAFANWQFDQDVDDTIFQPKLFTTEKILEINFAKIKDALRETLKDDNETLSN